MKHFYTIHQLLGWKQGQQTIDRQGFGLSLLKMLIPFVWILLMASFNDYINLPWMYHSGSWAYEFINILLVLLISSYLVFFIVYFVQLSVMRLRAMTLSPWRALTFIVAPLIPLWILIFLIVKKVQ